MTKRLIRAVPNEQWQLVLEFDGPEYRLFSTSILCDERGWKQLAYPQHMKRFVLTPDAIGWDGMGSVDAAFLHARSTPLTRSELEQETLRLSYKNQAPTSEHKDHHVYGVFLARFGEQPFRLEESIGGGMAERGGESRYSLAALLNNPDWQWHFTMSGCAWAIPVVEAHAGDPEYMMDSLVREACLRNGV